MRINNNLMAVNTHRQYTIANDGLAGSAEKLSSGYKINRAGDDAAGLAISEKMRAQVRGLNMASKNSQDAISLVQTAEGALQETHNILQRMRELAVQAGSDTNNDSIDREALDAEYQQLMAEIDQTADKTKFNNMGLIDGTLAGEATVYFDSTAAGNNLPKGVLMVSYDPNLVTGGGTSVADGDVFDTPAKGGAAGEIVIGGLTATFTAGDNKLVFNNGVVVTLEEAITQAEFDGSNQDLADNPLLGKLTGFAATFSEMFDGEASKTLTVQTGANQGDTLDINIDRMDAGRLGIADTDLLKGPHARDKAIQAVDDAVNAVSTQRGKLGALQNRLNHKISNLDTSAENLQAAESRIRDIDMAKEMSNYTKQNILIQASTAMLAQANSAPQNVLSLLQ